MSIPIYQISWLTFIASLFLVHWRSDDIWYVRWKMAGNLSCEMLYDGSDWPRLCFWLYQHSFGSVVVSIWII